MFLPFKQSKVVWAKVSKNLHHICSYLLSAYSVFTYKKPFSFYLLKDSVSQGLFQFLLLLLGDSSLSSQTGIDLSLLYGFRWKVEVRESINSYGPLIYKGEVLLHG